MASAGDAQEARAKEFLMRLGYSDLIVGDRDVERELGLKSTSTRSNCADIVGFRPGRRTPNAAVVCESKGTDVAHSLVQVGNAAAALMEMFAAAKRSVDLLLLVYVAGLRAIDIGDSPGPGFLAGPEDASGLRRLLDAGTAEIKPFPAQARIDKVRLDVKLLRWADPVSRLPVYLHSER